MNPLDYILIVVALGLAIGATPYLHRMYIVHTAAKRVDLFFQLPCEETYGSAVAYCLLHRIRRDELPSGYFAKMARMEEAIYSLRALGRPATTLTQNVQDQTPAAQDSANTTGASSRLSASVLFALVLGSWLLSPPAFASDPIPLSAHPSSVVVSGQRSGKIQHGNDTLLKSAGLIIEGDWASLLFVNSSHELLNLLFPPILFNSELDGKVENVFPLFMSSGEMGNEPTGKRTEQPTNNDASEGNKRDDNEQVIFGEFAEKLVHRMLCGIAAGCAVIVLGWVIIALLTAGFGYANDKTVPTEEGGEKL